MRSSETSFLSILIIPNWLKLCEAEPCVPRLPPAFWKIVLIFEAVLFLLSVRVSTITATLCGVIVDCNIETGLANKIDSYIFGDQFSIT